MSLVGIEAEEEEGASQHVRDGQREGRGDREHDDAARTYGEDLPDAYPLYAVAALQVVLAAVEGSDGTRRGINQEVFSGQGITVPAGVSAIGQQFTVSPVTGDVDLKNISVYRILAGHHVLLTELPEKP